MPSAQDFTIQNEIVYFYLGGTSVLSLHTFLGKLILTINSSLYAIILWTTDGVKDQKKLISVYRPTRLQFNLNFTSDIVLEASSDSFEWYLIVYNNLISLCFEEFIKSQSKELHIKDILCI